MSNTALTGLSNRGKAVIAFQGLTVEKCNNVATRLVDCESLLELPDFQQRWSYFCEPTR